MHSYRVLQSEMVQFRPGQYAFPQCIIHAARCAVPLDSDDIESVELALADHRVGLSPEQLDQPRGSIAVAHPQMSAPLMESMGWQCMPPRCRRHRFENFAICINAYEQINAGVVNPLILSVTQIKTTIVSAKFTEFHNSYFIIELSYFIIPYRTSKSPQQSHKFLSDLLDFSFIFSVKETVRLVCSVLTIGLLILASPT